MHCTVLVVDDDLEFRRLAIRMIGSLGMKVVAEAGTYAAATAAADKLRPEAALVDVGLPDGDGVELAEYLAALPWGPRVVLTSSDADATTPAAARSVGAAGFIAKDELADGSLLAMLAGR